MNQIFEKIERFDGFNPERCLLWLDEMFSMIENHGRNHREELLFNSGGSVQRTLYSISQEATPDQIKEKHPVKKSLKSQDAFTMYSSLPIHAADT